MDLYARVNILDGRAVRLPRGDVATAISLEADPVARAQGWVAKGADKLLIIDLDAAAYGNYGNRPLVRRIIDSVDIPVVVGGGVRSAREVEELLGAGAWRVTMGTVALVELSSAGAGGFMIAEAGRDALYEPPNHAALGLALRTALPEEEVVAAGGVRNLDDLEDLCQLDADGAKLSGVVVGREITEGRFTFEEAKAMTAANT